MAAVNLGTGVTPGPDADIIFNQTVGQAILAGQIVHEDPADGKWRLGSNASVTSPRRVGVALNSAPTVGQLVDVQYGGTVLNTATLVVGETYQIAATAGSVAPVADILAAAYASFIGIAPTATSLKLRPLIGVVAHA